jgi:cyclic dehypoxanthinyl futalosine synthase
VTATSEILAKALDGERITDADALSLLRSRDLVSVGRVANELRERRTNPEHVTFIVDRNVN